MSKKIIYLLSLLMALSLVFASCKKNSPTDSIGNLTPPPTDEDNTEGLVGEDGLANVDTSDQLDSEKPLTTTTVFKGNNVDYLRTPVVHVMGDKRNIVAVFGERRYKSQGAVNDVGIDGEHAVDVIYNVSFNAGKRFEGVKSVGEAATSVNNSRGAPVVFKIDQKTVVIAANSGVGIARTTDTIVKNNPSKLEYIIGTLDENSKDFKWGKWTEITIDNGSLLKIISTITTTADKNLTYAQMGTHSGKGQVVSKNTLILPVVMAQQGTSSSPKEIMGVYFIKGTYDNGGTSGSVTWTKLADESTEGKTYFRFAARGSNYSYYKETIVINATSAQDFQYIAIPSGGTKYGLGKNASGTIANATDTAITGWFGSPDYLTLQWYGSTNYKIQDYKTAMADGNAKNHNQSLFIGAQVDAPNGNVTLYKVQKGTLTRNGKGHVFNATSKSGSLDVLGDGTIVTVSEDGATKEWDYVTVFRRHSQKYLASLLDN